MTINNKLSWKGKIPLNKFMLTFTHNEDSENIYETTEILSIGVENWHWKPWHLFHNAKNVNLVDTHSSEITKVCQMRRQI